MSEFLSPEELRELTGKRRAGDQASELEALGIPHRFGPRRRCVIVSRQHVREWLSGSVLPASAAPRLDLVR